MRTYIAVGLGTSVLIALNELRFLGRTGLAFVIMGMAVVLIIHGAILWRLVGKE